MTSLTFSESGERIEIYWKFWFRIRVLPEVRALLLTVVEAHEAEANSAVINKIESKLDSL